MLSPICYYRISYVKMSLEFSFSSVHSFLFIYLFVWLYTPECLFSLIFLHSNLWSFLPRQVNLISLPGCRITVPNTLEGLKQIQPSSRTCSTSSWVSVKKQSTLCEANMVTNRALDLAAHQLHIFVVLCSVGSIDSKLVMCLSSSHMTLCEFLICNQYCNSKYIYIVAYCFISSWILTGEKTQQINKREVSLPARDAPVKDFCAVSTVAVITDGAESHHSLGKFRDCSSYRTGVRLAGIPLITAAGIRPSIHLSI